MSVKQIIERQHNDVQNSKLEKVNQLAFSHATPTNRPRDYREQIQLAVRAVQRSNHSATLRPHIRIK